MRAHAHTHPPTHTRARARRVGLLWTSDKLVAEATQLTRGTNIDSLSGIRTRDPSNQMSAEVCRWRHGHRDRQENSIRRKLPFN
jgi:hypothetical protein